MKAKSNYSSLVEEAAVKGTMGGIAAVTIFVGGFLVFSASCLGGAIVSLMS
jgi:hypothetical protein